MGWRGFAVLLCASAVSCGSEVENNLLGALVSTLKDEEVNQQLIFELTKDHQQDINRTIALVIKYAVKREVDKYRQERSGAAPRRQYGSFVMKLLDIAQDLPQGSTHKDRIDTAHRLYKSVDEDNAEHDTIADIQLFHGITRLYDILYTAPYVLGSLGNYTMVSAKDVQSRLQAVEVEPIHLAIAILVQYNLRRLLNYMISWNILETFTVHQMTDTTVVQTLKDMAAFLLPVSELIHRHLTYQSNVFRDHCPNSWLAIVNPS